MDTTSDAAKRFRLRGSVKVRPHASGAWTAVIGKAVNEAGTALVPKQFYFKATEVAAQAEADRLLAKWHFIFKHWGTNYRPTLKAIGSPFADEPHWDRALATLPKLPTDAEAEEYQQNQPPPTADEIGEAYADVTLQSVFGLYAVERKLHVAQGDVRQATIAAETKNIRNALAYFPAGLRMDQLTQAVLKDAKAEMLGAVERRTAKNYLGAMKAMLKWFYDGSDYGRWHEKPTNFDGIFSVKGAVRTDIKTHGTATLKTLMEAASGRMRLYIMLALNCGMYQTDIGKLEPSEFDLQAGYVYWDREKEPTNPFKVRHDLWPETLTLVRQYMEPSGRYAFLSDTGKPLHVTTENGTYDRISERYKLLRAKDASFPTFKELRKSTNQALVDLLHSKTDEPLAVDEISKEYLGQKTPTLSRLYSQRGLKTYDRMNRYLKAVGDVFRAEGVFDCLTAKNAV